ncbi:MAG: hypothetical protein N3A59_04825 [Thermodesulfovibrionales bacterium]|nr:hypothetical protein [Thermodesulfovibrionales bacterium]
MFIVRYIVRSLTVLNIILLITVSALVYLYILPLLSIDIQLALKPIKAAEKNEEITQHSVQTLMLADYLIIADQNIFHPERKIPEKKEEKQLPKPEFILYGTLITDDQSIAYLEDLKAPHTTAGRGKRQKTLQKGGSLSGFILSEVYHDKIVMTRGDERLEVSINENTHKKSRTTETTSTKNEPSVNKPETTSIKEPSQRGRVQATVTDPSIDRRRSITEERQRRRDEIRQNRAIQ